MQKNDKIIVMAELSTGILSLKPTTKEDAAALTRWNTNRSPDGDDIEIMYPDTAVAQKERHCPICDSSLPPVEEGSCWVCNFVLEHGIQAAFQVGIISR